MKWKIVNENSFLKEFRLILIFMRLLYTCDMILISTFLGNANKTCYNNVEVQ